MRKRNHVLCFKSNYLHWHWQVVLQFQKNHETDVPSAHKPTTMASLKADGGVPQFASHCHDSTMPGNFFVAFGDQFVLE